MWMPESIRHQDPETTPEEVLWATDLFNTYQGCCYNYSSAFMYIMRYLGYDAHLLSGQVSSYNGGTTPHCWLYVNLGGEAYTFRPGCGYELLLERCQGGKHGGKDGYSFLPQNGGHELFLYDRKVP